MFIKSNYYQICNNVELLKRNTKLFNNHQNNFDTVSFSGRRPKSSAEERMTIYANQLLKEQGLQKGQQVYIKGESYYLPFMDILTKEAYKNHSGLVHLDVEEESLKNLKKKYNKTAEFDYKKEIIQDLKNENALFFEFSAENDPYKKSKVYKTEAKEEQSKNYFTVPPQITKLFKINPKEVLVEALDMKEGQMLHISGEREHLPFIKKLVNYLYSKNNTDIVEVNIKNDSDKNKLLYADEEVLEQVPKYLAKRENEYFEKDVAAIYLDGEDPNKMTSVDTERILKSQRARNNDKDFISAWNKTATDIPWLVYYAPTTMSSKEPYAEFGDDKLGMIAKAYEDANKINRMGHLKEHVDELNFRAEKLNEIMEKGYRTFHYISIDPDTQKPDGKTDFKITMSPLSFFQAARMSMPLYGHNPLVNIPTEEVFTSPQCDTAEGVLSATMPLSLNGKTIEGLQLKFKDGKVVDVKASKNEDMIKSYIEKNENADMLGEVAIVAGSPIAQMNKLFNSVLLDENASCHLAIGNSYSDTIKGVENLNYDEIDEYLDKHKINRSSIHTDFMIGGKNVVVKALNKETGDEILIMENDKFLL